MIKCEVCGRRERGSVLDRLLAMDPELIDYAVAIRLWEGCSRGAGCGAARAITEMRTLVNHPDMWIGRGGGDFVPLGVKSGDE